MSHLEIAGSAQVAVMAMRSPVRNPNGRTGSPEHQAALAQQQEAVLLRGEGWTWGKEVCIRTPGGSRPYRFADGGAFYNNEQSNCIRSAGAQGLDGPSPESVMP